VVAPVSSTTDRVCLARLHKAVKIARICRDERLSPFEVRHLDPETKRLIEQVADVRQSSEVTWEIAVALLDF
jgi:hypothetical protein